MSIVACVKVYDGIVLGADSASQITGQDPQGRMGVLKVYENARKLFRFLDFKVGILSYGIGNIGKKFIDTLLREFKRESREQRSFDPADYNVRGIAQGLYDFFIAKYNEQFQPIPDAQRPPLGFYVAGYSSGSTDGEELEFLIPRANGLKEVRPANAFGASWRGAGIPFTRLYYGFDPRVNDKLIEAGVNENTIKQACDPFKAQVIYDGMPVSEAVKFVEFILKTTIGLVSFEVGAPVCSEPIHIGVINSETGFQWVIQPSLTPEGREVKA